MPIKTAPPPDPGAPPIPPPNPPPVPCVERIDELEREKEGATDAERDAINGEILVEDCKLIGIKPITGPGKGDL